MKIDLSKVKTKDYLKWLKSQDIFDLFNILSQATNKEIDSSFLSDVPSIFAEFTKEMKTWNDNIIIAVTSMTNYLTEVTSNEN